MVKKKPLPIFQSPRYFFYKICIFLINICKLPLFRAQGLHAWFSDRWSYLWWTLQAWFFDRRIHFSIKSVFYNKHSLNYCYSEPRVCILDQSNWTSIWDFNISVQLPSLRKDGGENRLALRENLCRY